MNVNLQLVTVTLAANETRSINKAGSFLVLQSSTAAFNFSIDGGLFQTGLCVMTFDAIRAALLSPAQLIPGQIPGFKEIILQDTSGAPNTITIFVADSSVSYYAPPNIISVKDSPTYTKSTTERTLAANTTVTFSGVDGGKIRKQIVITNEDATNVIEVWDSTGNPGATIYPQRSWTIATSGVVKVRNPNGSAVNVTVLETFYS